MTDFSKYDVVVVKFPFASSLKYKARPAVIISSPIYNQTSRNSLLILAISSQTDSILSMEFYVEDWKEAGLLKPSIFKSSIATIEKDVILTRLGTLSQKDAEQLDAMIDGMC